MKNNFYIILFIVLFSTIIFYPQTKNPPKLFPVDQISKDKSLVKFKSEVLSAIEKKDTNFIISILDTNILNSFGGNGGIKEFWQMWQMEDSNSSFWKELKKVFTMGGTFINNDRKLFALPYVFGIWPEDYDPFSYVAVIGKNIDLHENPSIKSKVIKKLSYDILSLLYTEDEIYDWEKVMTYDSVSGYVQRDLVRSPIDFRAILQKDNGKWKMISFVAGD